MEFNKDISDLQDTDLPRYKDFLLNQILGDQPKEKRRESFRLKILDRVDQVSEEIKVRNEHRQCNEGGSTASE